MVRVCCTEMLGRSTQAEDGLAFGIFARISGKTDKLLRS